MGGEMRHISEALVGAREALTSWTNQDWQHSEPTPVETTYGVPPVRWARETFETFDLALNSTMADALKQVWSVVRGDAWCAMLIGLPGNGKTHLAIAAMHEFSGAKQFWKVPGLLAHLRRIQFDQDGERFIEGFQTDRIPGVYGQTTGGAVTLREPFYMRRLLVLDDLGVENQTEWAYEQLYRILDARCDNQLPTIITSNVGMGRIDARIMSRYANGLVVCEGKDMRRQDRR